MVGYPAERSNVLGRVQEDFEDGLQGFEAFKMPDWVVERQQLLMEVDELRQHKDWADRRIDTLLKRATGAERPQIAETNRLREEVSRLRQVCAFLHISCTNLTYLKHGACIYHHAAKLDLHLTFCQWSDQAPEISL